MFLSKHKILIIRFLVFLFSFLYKLFYALWLILMVPMVNITSAAFIYALKNNTNRFLPPSTKKEKPKIVE